VLTRKRSITPVEADPGQPTHPQATWRPLEPVLAAPGAGPPSGPPSRARSAGPARADTSPAQRLPARRSPGYRPPPSSRQPTPVGTARLLVDGRARSRWQGCDADGSPGPRRWRATAPHRAAQPCPSPLLRPPAGRCTPRTSLVCRAATPNVYLPPAGAETLHWSPWLRHCTGHPARTGNRRCEADVLTPA
jgi:hypothetical protein